ncbi:MAG: hypothetical protein H6622_11105 [Halobacteriovoraceae bacterium]|nr:hypothetical protein [Halobacteriovoraceae bacterium]
MKKIPPLFYILMLSQVLISCDQKDYTVNVYETKKETNSLFQNSIPEENTQTLSWTAPKHWVKGSANGMRIASFNINEKDKKAEVTIITLSGMAGGLAPNINRWRGQIGLPDVSEQEVKNSISTVDGTLTNYLYQFIENPEKQKGILAAIAKHNGMSLFIKAMGDLSVIKNEEQTFKNFLKTIHENKN